MWLLQPSPIILKAKKPDTLSVEQCISKGVFGRDRNVFDDFRKEAAQIQIKENTAIGTDNKATEKRKIPCHGTLDFMEWTQNRIAVYCGRMYRARKNRKYEETVQGCAELLLLPDRKKPTCSLWNNVTKAKMVRTEQDEIMKEEKHETVVPANDAETTMYKRYKVRK